MSQEIFQFEDFIQRNPFIPSKKTLRNWIGSNHNLYIIGNKKFEGFFSLSIVSLGFGLITVIAILLEIFTGYFTYGIIKSSFQGTVFWIIVAGALVDFAMIIFFQNALIDSKIEERQKLIKEIFHKYKIENIEGNAFDFNVKSKQKNKYISLFVLLAVAIVKTFFLIYKLNPSYNILRAHIDKQNLIFVVFIILSYLVIALFHYFFSKRFIKTINFIRSFNKDKNEYNIQKVSYLNRNPGYANNEVFNQHALGRIFIERKDQFILDKIRLKNLVIFEAANFTSLKVFKEEDKLCISYRGILTDSVINAAIFSQNDDVSKEIIMACLMRMQLQDSAYQTQNTVNIPYSN